MNVAIAAGALALVVLGLWMPVGLERAIRQAVALIGA
jgi:hypothetical protein